MYEMGSSAGKLEGNYEQSMSMEDMDYVDDDPVSIGNCSNAYCLPPSDYENMMIDHIYPTTVEWLLIGAHFIVFTGGLLGNFLVCVAVYRNTSMRTVTNYFIVNLAVADFMVILFCLPPTLVWDVTETWFLGDALCKIVLYFQTVSVSVSVLTLTFIAVERWYAICFPLKFKATTSRAKRAIIAIWLISLTFDIPELVVLHTKPREGVPDHIVYFTQCEPSWGGMADMTYSIFRMILLYFLPLVFMSFAYYQIARVLWSSTNIPGAESGGGGGGRRGDHREPTLSSNGNNTHVQYTARLTPHTTRHMLTPIHRGTSVSQGNAVDFQLRSRRKAAKMLIYVFSLFMFSYLPVHIYTILNLIITIPQNDIFGALVGITHLLPYLNSATNPLIYNFMSQKFQTEFLRMFGCWMLRRRTHRLPIRRRAPTTSGAYSGNYSGYPGRGMSTYSRNYPCSRMETSQTQITATIVFEKI